MLIIISDSNEMPTENTAWTLKYHFLTQVFSKQNGVGVKLLDVITWSQRINLCNVFANKNVNVMINPDSNVFPSNVRQTNQGSFHYYQIKTHVQTACEPPDLNMEFCSFDNGFKQLSVTNFMQE